MEKINTNFTEEEASFLKTKDFSDSIGSTSFYNDKSISIRIEKELEYGKIIFAKYFYKTEYDTEGVAYEALQRKASENILDLF